MSVLEKLQKILDQMESDENLNLTNLNISNEDLNFLVNYVNESFTCKPCIILEVYMEKLHIYYVPILITIGLIGNFVSLFVFMGTHLKMHSSSYYLAALAVVEFLFVLTILFVHFDFNNILGLYNKNVWCQLFVYTSSVCSTLNTWLIVAFTVERFIAVQYPLKRPHICTVSRAKLIVTLLIIFALIFQSYVFWMATIIKTNDGNDICEMKPEYRDAMKVINFFDTVLTLIVPTILIIVMNVMIARNIYLFKIRLKNNMSRTDDAVGRGKKDGVFLEISISKVK